jgi:prevent-host-death family protein
MARPGDIGYIYSRIPEGRMASYSVAEAKNQLPSLINKALGGEEVVITRHGRAVAEIRPRKTLTREARAALYARMAAEASKHPVGVSAVELVRLDRDEGP